MYFCNLVDYVEDRKEKKQITKSGEMITVSLRF